MMKQKCLRLVSMLLALAMSLTLCAATPAFAAEGKTYKEGDSGSEIRNFKLRLYELGYFTTNNLSKKFSAATTEAVTAFQQENGLEPTGEVSPDTWELLFSDAAKPHVTPTPSPAPTPAPTPYVEYPARDADGYLLSDDEYVYENDDAGQWIYITNSLQISIRKFADESVPLEWFETDIKMRGDEQFLTVENNPDRPGTRFSYPFDIAKNNNYILGFSDDFYGDRISQKKTVGVVVRNGQIISDKTYSKETHFLPNLDVLAQYPDGSLMVYECNEHTAEELVQMGAINVFCFGPILIRDGKMGGLVEEGYFETKSPRQALGMYEPGHYMLLSVCGRLKTSIGCGLTKMAEIMLERGVQQALNLDGGNTMALVFRGRMLNKLATWKKKKFVRTVTSLIGVGTGEYTVE